MEKQNIAFDTLPYDISNFFTYITSDNKNATLPKGIEQIKKNGFEAI